MVVTAFDDIYRLLLNNELSYIYNLTDEKKQQLLAELNIPFSNWSKWDIMNKVYDFVEMNIETNNNFVHKLIATNGGIGDKYFDTPLHPLVHRGALIDDVHKYKYTIIRPTMYINTVILVITIPFILDNIQHSTRWSGLATNHLYTHYYGQTLIYDRSTGSYI